MEVVTEEIIPDQADLDLQKEEEEEKIRKLLFRSSVPTRDVSIK